MKSPSSWALRAASSEAFAVAYTLLMIAGADIAGDRVPVDGEIATGRAVLDTAALTGEPLPVEVSPGDTVLSPARRCLRHAGSFAAPRSVVVVREHHFSSHPHRVSCVQGCSR